MSTIKKPLKSSKNINYFLPLIISIFLLIAIEANSQVTSRIISSTGDGSGNTLDSPWVLCVDSDGNVYITGGTTDNAFKITPGGTVTEIIDATGDGSGNTLDNPQGIAVDKNGNVYVTGAGSDNAFKITPGGVITEIIDATGDGSGNTLNYPVRIAVKADGTAYIAGGSSDNAFEISTSNVVTEIIDATGDGSGNTLDNCRGVAVDSSGNIYVTGSNSDNAFKITSSSTITEIIDAAGDGSGNTLDYPFEITVDASNNVYVAGASSDNAFKITSALAITEIIDATGDGSGNTLDNPRGLAVSPNGYVLVSGQNSDNLFKITPSGTVSELIDATGDGTNTLDAGRGVALLHDSAYVAGGSSDNAFAIKNVTLPVELIEFSHVRNQNSILLQWTTAWEENNSHFILEKSSNGEAFQLITKLAGKGYSTDFSHYQFHDYDINNQKLIYRLKQIDFDGTSKTIGFIKVLQTVDSKGFSIYPNPVKNGFFQIELPANFSQENPTNIEILDLSGNVIIKTVEQTSAKTSLLANINRLQSGMYICRISQKNVVRNTLFLVE